jgi:hypothetical protein
VDEDALSVSSQKEGGSGVFWAGFARPKHPAPRFIEKIPLSLITGEFCRLAELVSNHTPKNQSDSFKKSV